MSSFILLLTPLQNKCFCSLNSHPVVYFIIQEMYGFPRQFLIAWENPTKHILWKGPGKLVLILFPQCRCFFSNTFSSYGGNYTGFQSISSFIGKCSKIHRIGRTQKIGTHTFPKYGYFSSIRFPPYGILYYMGNAQFSHQFPITRKKTAKSTL